MRRWVLLLVALALAAGPVAVVPPAQADAPCGSSGPCIAVTEAGVATQYVTASQLTEWSDIPTQGCSVRRVPYAVPITCDPVTSGLSIQALLSHLPVQIPLNSVQLVTVSGHADNPSTLTGDEVSAPTSPFAGGAEPIFSVPGTDSIGYQRPLLVSDADTNATDGQFTDPDGEMDVTVYPAGQVLHPTVTVDPAHVKVGQSIRATASLAPGELPAGVTYNWNFYAGPIDEQDPSNVVTHMYGKGSKGTAYVSVSVQRDVGTSTPAYGASAPVLVRIGKAITTPPAKNPHPGTGTGKKSNPVVGPNKGKGKQPGGAPGKGQGTNPTKPKAPRSPAPSPSSETTAPPAEPTGGSTGSAGPTSTAPPAPAEGAKSRRRASSTPATSAEFGALVHGTVIDSAAQPRAVAPSARSTPATAPSARRPSTQPFDARLLWWLLLPVLIGVGMLSEVRRPRSRRRTG